MDKGVKKKCDWTYAVLGLTADNMLDAIFTATTATDECVADMACVKNRHIVMLATTIMARHIDLTESCIYPQ